MRIRYSKLFVGICLPALCTGLASLLLFTSAVAQTIRPSTQKELKVFDPTTNGTGNIGLRAAAGTSSYTLTLPASAPSVNQVLSASAVTGGNVSLTWATPVSGTVTSVGSNSGTGLTGGPITGAGTLAIDTVLISTRLWRQKGIDSVAALANTKVSSVSGTAPISSSGGTSPTISISQASGSANGFLTSSDWTTFNNKQNAITLTTTGTSGAATLVGATLNIPQYQAALTNPVTGTGALNYLSKFATAGTLTNSLLFDNGTNVGIGTTSPANLLDVAGTFRATGSTIVGGMLTLSSTASAAAADSVLMINSSSQVTKTTRAALFAGSGWALTGNASTNASTNFIGTTDAVDFVARTNNTERMRITSAGNVIASGNLQYKGRLLQAADDFPIYTFYFGGATDLSWQNIADITLGSTIFEGLSLEINITDANTNLGHTADQISLQFFVSALRSHGAADNPNSGTVSGPIADYVRLVKTATGSYQVQVRQISVYRNIRVVARVTSTCCSSSISWKDTPTPGATTGTIYTATPIHTQRFTNLSVAGTVTLPGTASAAAGDDVLMINSSNQVTKTTRAALVGSSGWTLTGNAGTSASTNFIGTTDAVDFVARTNNTERMRITSDGNVQIRNNNVAGDNSVARPGILEFMGSGWQTTNGAMPVGIRLTPVVEYWNNNPNSPYGQTWPDLAFSFLNSSGSPSYLERMRITGAGNVGIGTTSPTVRLHVSGSSILANNTTINPDSYANQIIAGAIADGSGWGAPGIGGNQGSGASWAIGHNGANLYFGMQNGSANATMQTYMQFAPDRNLYLVPTSGNVYVGSRGNNSSTAGLALWTSPIGTAFGTDNAGLDIRTPATNGVTRNVLIGQVYGGNALTDWANAQLAFSLSNAFTSKAWAIAALGVQDALTFRFQNGVPPSNTLLSDELMRITSAGNLGLGTTTIGSRLQVNGNAAIGYSASTAAPTNGLAVAGVIRQGNASILTSTRNDNVAVNGTLDLTISNSVGFVGHLYVQNTSLTNTNNRTYTVFFVAGRYSSNSTITELNSANGASTRSFSVANVSTSTSNILRITNTSSEATSISAVFVGSDGF